MDAEKETKSFINDLLLKDADWKTAAIELTKIFLQKKYNVNMTINLEGQTTLLLATINKKYNLVNWLLTYYNDTINVSKEDRTGTSPLSAAISNNDKVVFSLLVRNEKNPPKIKNVKGADGVTPLMFAIREKIEDFFMDTLIEKEEDLNFYDTDIYGNTALSLLLNLRNFPNNERFTTSDEYIARSIFILILKYNLKYNDDFLYFLIDNDKLNSEEHYFVLLSSKSISVSSLEIYENIPKNELNKKNGMNQTLIFYAVKKGSINAVKNLLKVGADPNITCRDDNGQESSALICSIETLNFQITVQLLTHVDIKVNYRTPDVVIDILTGETREGVTALIALSEIEWTEFINDEYIYDIMQLILEKKKILRTMEMTSRMCLQDINFKKEEVTKMIFRFINQGINEKYSEMRTVFKNIIDMVIQGVNAVYANPYEIEKDRACQLYLRYMELFLEETDGSVTLHTEMDSGETFLAYAGRQFEGYSW